MTTETKPQLLKTFSEYKQRHIDRPQSWSMQEAIDASRSIIQTNLRPRYTSHYATRRHPSWYGEVNKVARMLFARELGKAFKDEDSGEALDVIHNHLYRTVVETATTDWADLIKTKCSDDYIHECNDCNHIDHADNGSWAYDNDWVCQSCLDNNYRWSEYRDTYISEEEWQEEQEENEGDDDDEDRIIGDYHDSKRVLGHIPSKYDAYKSPDRPSQPILLGMELEVEVSEDYNSGDKARELYDEVKYVQGSDGRTYQYCFTERDGSLNHGFEIVTGYTGLDVHAKQLEFFKTPWRGVRSHDTRTCGLHVHIDKAGMSLFHACKMVFFIHDSNNQKLIKDIARRANADYAQIKNKKASYQWLKRAKSSGNPLNYLNEDRREALNFQNDNTIEFRLFKGTLRYETIMACLEFTYATWFFCRDTGITELTTPNFIDFICQPQQREHTKFLRSYLREKGYSLPRLALVKPNPRAEGYVAQPVEQLAA